MKRILIVLTLLLVSCAAFADTIFYEGGVEKFRLKMDAGLLKTVDPAGNLMWSVTDSGTTSIFTLNGTYVGTWAGTALTDAQVSDTLTASIVKGSGSTTDAVDLATAEVAGTLAASAVGNGLTDAQVANDQTIVSTSQLSATSASTPVILGVATSTATNTVLNGLSVRHQTSADMVDGFGAGIGFRATDSGVSNALLGSVCAVRDSADTEGAVKIYAGTNGLELIATFDSNLKTTLAGALTAGGLVTTSASAAVAGAGLNLPHGVVPNSPNNGDVWTTTAGYFVRINGVSEQLTTASGGAFTTLSVTGSGAIGTTSGGLNVGSAAVSAGADGELRVNTTDLGAFSVQGTTFNFSGAGTIGGIVTLSAASMVTPATFTFGSAATALSVGAATGTCTVNNATLALNGYQWNSGAASVKHYDRILSFDPTGWYQICSFDMGSAANWAGVGLHIEFNASGYYTYAGSWVADLMFTKDASANHFKYVSSRGIKGVYDVKVRDMGSNVFQVWAYGQQYCGGPVSITYRESAAGLVSFANFNAAGTGGSSDVAEVGTYQFGGGAVTTVGGLHVGGTSDPGADNLIVDGVSTFTGDINANSGIIATTAASAYLFVGATLVSIGAGTGYCLINNAYTITSGLSVGLLADPGSGCLAVKHGITSGVNSTERGSLTLWDGADGNKASYVLMHSRNGTAHYLWFEDDGTLKQSTSEPSANADGAVVGAQT